MNLLHWIFLILISLSGSLMAEEVIGLKDIDEHAREHDRVVKNALRGSGLDPNVIEKSFKKKRSDREELKYDFVSSEEIGNDTECGNCPQHLRLTNEINNVIDKMERDPSLKTTEELPAKLNRLKFMYYTVARNAQNNEPNCQLRFNNTNEISDRLDLAKYDQQFQLMAEDAFSFKSVTEVQYLNPAEEETTYYYRGEGDQKDIIVQAILTKTGGQFRYYRYKRKESEENPYIQSDEHEGEQQVLDQRVKASKTNEMHFKAEIEYQHGIARIPENIHLGEATIHKNVYGNVSLNGNSDFSIKKNVINLVLQKDEKNLLFVNVKNEISGKTDYEATIPYLIRVPTSEGQLSVAGMVQNSNRGNLVTMVLKEGKKEYLRGEYRVDAATGKSSYNVSNDTKIGASTVNLQYSKDDNNESVALTHSTTLKKINATLVLQAHVTRDGVTTFYYQVDQRY